MELIEKLNKSKVPIIAFDKKLEKLKDKVLFPEKVAKANEILKKVGTPFNKKYSELETNFLF